MSDDALERYFRTIVPVAGIPDGVSVALARAAADTTLEYRCTCPEDPRDGDCDDCLSDCPVCGWREPGGTS